jgi:hypothetical protein
VIFDWRVEIENFTVARRRSSFWCFAEVVAVVCFRIIVLAQRAQGRLLFWTVDLFLGDFEAVVG